MKKYSKLKENRYYGYSDGKNYYVTDKISKSKMIGIIVEKFRGSASWVKCRISEGGNEKALEALKDNPDALMIILEDRTYKILEVVK